MLAPSKYETLQDKSNKIGFFTYSDEPGKHYVEYQGTDANTPDELESYARRRAEAICGKAPANIEVNRDVWVGRGYTTQSTYIPGGKVPMFFPMPRAQSETFPKVWARFTCD